MSLLQNVSIPTKPTTSSGLDHVETPTTIGDIRRGGLDPTEDSQKKSKARPPGDTDRFVNRQEVVQHTAMSSPLRARPPSFLRAPDAILDDALRTSDVHMGTCRVEGDSGEIQCVLRLQQLLCQRFLSPCPSSVCNDTQGRDGIG